MNPVHLHPGAVQKFQLSLGYVRAECPQSRHLSSCLATCRRRRVASSGSVAYGSRASRCAPGCPTAFVPMRLPWL